MKKKILILILPIIFVFLFVACENSTEISNTKDNQSQNNHSSQDIKERSSIVDSTEKDSNIENSYTDNSTVEKQNEVKNELDDHPSTNYTEASFKEAYLKKLNDTEIETEKLEATDSSTYALKKVENDKWDIWDDLLNEIYGVLKEQLPSEEMAQLREEQRNWIDTRDSSALEASLKYKGGTQEHLEYVAVLAELTKERSYELVEEYMN